MTVLTLSMLTVFTIVGNIGASHAATNESNLTSSSITTP